MYKLIGSPPKSLTAANVVDICSAGICGGCDSPYFADYIQYWKHNGWWFFDSPEIIEAIASKENIDLTGLTLFYYEFFEQQFDKDDKSISSAKWSPVKCTNDFITNVVVPKSKHLLGYDVVEYVYENSAGCSLMSCSNLAAEFLVNNHCLLPTIESAQAALESGKFLDKEPGPYRIVAVHKVNV